MGSLRGLSPGGHIRVIAPAGAVRPERIALGLSLLRDRGFRVSLGRHVFDRDPQAPYLAGTDEDRLFDLHEAFIDASFEAVVCARGGYGVMRVLPGLDRRLLASHPKPLVGFSDVTALHAYLNQLCGMPSLHGPMLATVGASATAVGVATADTHTQVDGMVEALCGSGRTAFADLDVWRAGSAEGPLVGGNLSLVESLVGTPYLPTLRGGVLLLEEVGESAYRIDRMLSSLAMRGHLAELAGIVIGDTGSVGDWAVPRDRHASVIRHRLLALTEPYGTPVFGGLAIGHGHQNLTVPLGTLARLTDDGLLEVAGVVEPRA